MNFIPIGAGHVFPLVLAVSANPRLRTTDPYERRLIHALIGRVIDRMLARLSAPILAVSAPTGFPRGDLPMSHRLRGLDPTLLDRFLGRVVTWALAF